MMASINDRQVHSIVTCSAYPFVHEYYTLIRTLGGVAAANSSQFRPRGTFTLPNRKSQNPAGFYTTILDWTEYIMTEISYANVEDVD